jgi:hypothetical protein
MNAGFDCLSLPELLDIRNGTADTGAVRHLDACLRCRAVLRTIPGDFALREVNTAAPVPPANAPRRNVRAAGSTSPGALWRALGQPDDDFAWVVAIIGTAPDATDRMLVAPVFGPPAIATEQDLLLDTAVLGYPAFADVANTGTILRHQLTEPLGELTSTVSKTLLALYRAVLSDGPAPPSESVGVPVTSSDDPRLLDADARRDALRQLWRAADRLVDADHQETDDDTTQTIETAVVITLPVLLGRYVCGPGAEWDRPTLLEASGVDGGRFNQFFANRLDLVERQDITDLAKVVHTLHISWEEAEPPIVTALRDSPGGAWQTDHPAEMPLAARGASGATDKGIRAALRRQHGHADESQSAREQLVAAYVAELRKLLDDLG